jgi:hypothetical protein
LDLQQEVLLMSVTGETKASLRQETT